MPLGPDVRGLFERREWLGDRDDAALAAARLRLGACDGTLALGTLVEAVLRLLGDDQDSWPALLEAVRGLVEAGVLLPSEPATPV
jgi:hypothetical protein